MKNLLEYNGYHAKIELDEGVKMRKKYEMIDDLDIAIKLLTKAKEEIGKSEVSKINGNICTAYNAEYSLNKVKRNCTTARELILNVRKGCEQ